MRKEAQGVLESILLDMWDVDMRLNTDLREEKLLGNKIKMESRDLVVLLLAIEDRLNIQIEKKSIIDGKFDTFHHILELICKALK